jgi:hypothetical protein
MKYVAISKLAPGIENTRKALEVFLKAGPPEGTQTLYASIDGKTVVNIIDAETVDLASAMTFAPFFEESIVIPVVEVDDGWLEAVQTAQANWD